ncbi:hypothetical protein WCE34_07020 [Luteimonas sp. MJ204]|uniref:hypothetical protein n=1 Tax=Luteimonas sp. MJ145 TaxID=3129234 RepID=UPI0031BA7B77
MMKAAGQYQESGKSPELRDKSRYAASIRLSVAPMMDWTDIAENLFSINKLDPLLRVALHLRCPEVTYGLS